MSSTDAPQGRQPIQMFFDVPERHRPNRRQHLGARPDDPAVRDRTVRIVPDIGHIETIIAGGCDQRSPIPDGLIR
jgi:hypothetical protein